MSGGGGGGGSVLSPKWFTHKQCCALRLNYTHTLTHRMCMHERLNGLQCGSAQAITCVLSWFKYLVLGHCLVMRVYANLNDNTHIIS